MSIFTERLNSHALTAERALEAWLPADAGYHRKLAEAMRYSALGGGKRLRAHLVLEFCGLCAGDEQTALPYAAAIEMMHAFSLIHDDLPSMDNDTLRRGKPTNHVVYGEATALLAGDALALRALETAASNPYGTDAQNAAAARLLAAYAGCDGMCGGQQIDLQSENRRISREELEELVNKKTGALFSAACELGCIAADVGAEKREAARFFGRTSGLAFQIADDLLDLRADAQTLGKTPGKDRQSGKSTFVSLLGEEGAESYAKRLCEDAKACLSVFPDGEAKKSLSGYCDYIVARKY